MSGIVKELYDEQALLELVSQLRRGHDVRLSCVMRLEALESSTDETFDLHVSQGDFRRGSCQISVSRLSYIDGVERALARINENIIAKGREIVVFLSEMRGRIDTPKENADG